MANPESATPTPHIEYATVCNNHGEAVNGLHLRLSGVNYANVLTNAPGCDDPTVALLGYAIMNASWTDSCVDPGESVLVGMADCFSLACGVPFITCYNWTIGGAPDPSPCDRCPSDVGELSITGSCNARLGDLNCDENINGLDAIAILEFFAALSSARQPPCPPVGSGVVFTFGDVDCAGALNVADVLRLLRYLDHDEFPLKEGCRAIGG